MSFLQAFEEEELVEARADRDLWIEAAGSGEADGVILRLVLTVLERSPSNMASAS